MRATTEHRNTMFSLIANWQQSGLSQKAFCEQHQIVPHVFYYWYKCYRTQNKVPVAQPARSFIELHSHPVISPETGIEVLLSCGHRILFHQPVAASFIKAIIS
jgi:transposase-like protein